MRKAASIVGVLALFGLVATSAVRAATSCVGDCNGDGMVSISELILGVNIALGLQPPSACVAFQDESGMVTISQLIKGVNNAQNGCPGGPTNTPTPTTPGGPTNTPTPTTRAGTLRIFTIDPGNPVEGPDTSRSGLFTSALSANAATHVPPGPLKLVLGTPGADGVASFRLQENVTLDLDILDGSRLCLKFDAASSHGTIDCDGGTPYDITATRPSDAPGIAFTFTTGLGTPAGPGNGNLIVSVLFQQTAIGETKTCDQIVYTNPVQDFAFTTTKGIAIIPGTDPLTGYEIDGEAFSCANFATSPGVGMLTAPLPANQAPVGNVDNALRFGETLPTTP